MNDTLQATSVAGTGVGFTNGDEIFIYRARADGLPESGSETVCSTACNRSVYTSGTWVRNGGSGWEPSTQRACLGGTIDSVGVSVRVAHQSPTRFFPFLNNIRLQERTVMRLEPLEESCTG